MMVVPKKVRQKAYNKVSAAIRSGNLVKPDSCQKCGEKERKGKDGRSLLQAHHENGYENPLDVVWVCVHCHAKDTPQPSGTENHLSKYTDDEVSIMRDLSLKPKEAAAILGCSKSYVNQVRRGEYRARSEQKEGE